MKALRCGQRLETLSIVLAKLQRMVIDFLNVVYAAHRSTLDVDTLDTLPQPTQRGTQRLAGVDLQKPRMRAVAEAVLALAPQPEGFTAPDVAAFVSIPYIFVGQPKAVFCSIAPQDPGPPRQLSIPSFCRRSVRCPSPRRRGYGGQRRPDDSAVHRSYRASVEHCRY